MGCENQIKNSLECWNESNRKAIIEIRNAPDDEKTLLKQQLVEENLKLVSYIIGKNFKELNNLGIEMSEIYSEGTYGLLKAINGFDLDRGTNFASYAICAIYRTIASFVCDRRKEMSTTISLDSPNHEGSLAVGAFITSRKSPNPEDVAVDNDFFRNFNDFCNLHLNDNQKKILMDLYVKGKSIKEVAGERGVTYQAIHYTKNAALDKLRGKVNNPWS